MKQEEKELLLKDLCARLPYETRVRYTYAFAGAACITGYSGEGILSYDKLQDFSQPNVGYETRRVVNILPYLRPMDSMTYEEIVEFSNIFSKWHDDELFDYIEEDSEFSIWKHKKLSPVVFDWLNKNMFDYRGLIPMGLALPAAPDMYY